jgi:hypothetical protein
MLHPVSYWKNFLKKPVLAGATFFGLSLAHIAHLRSSFLFANVHAGHCYVISTDPINAPLSIQRGGRETLTHSPLGPAATAAVAA